MSEGSENVEEQVYEPIPIIHKNKNYEFRASYDIASRAIKTSLWIDDPKGKGRKEYKNNINEGYFSKELGSVF